VFLLRRQLGTWPARLLIVAAVIVAGDYYLWRTERYDIWRHGVPSLGYLIRTYGPATMVAGLYGWAVAVCTVRSRATLQPPEGHRT
jgi:hypothetical protein